MKKQTVIFIASIYYDNLGVGYIASVLLNAGIETRIIDIKTKKKTILKIVRELDPLLIGFSVIFHDNINQFKEIIEYLRAEGIKCHFTAGGHYASLRYEDLFRNVHGLDSIVRFEGEYPVLELVNCLSNKINWRAIDGIVFIETDQIKTNPVWPLERNLDKFPFPLRAPLKDFAFKKKFATIIAGRGCTHNCTFCNTREFYIKALGPIKRIRKPESVVNEMSYLFKTKGCSVFLFQDDDFPLNSMTGNDWLGKFCSELERTGLPGKIIWKINCRPDEVSFESFKLMKRSGLFHVFLGIEDGTDAGLERLNKKMTVTKSLNGIKILKELGIGFDYGFMLFQPFTTFRSLYENLDFLKGFCEDGYTPVTFLKLVPMYATRVEKELMEIDRLKLKGGNWDYEFPEEPMNHYYYFVYDSFNKWMRSPEGIENLSKWAGNYFSVYRSFFEITAAGMKIHTKVRKIISESNLFLIDTMKELAFIFETEQYLENEPLLDEFRENIESKHRQFRDRIINTMADLVTLAEKQEGVFY
jgi:anaerobic magnesium-protoporphyrin IX monomethyl ester cyclase